MAMVHIDQHYIMLKTTEEENYKQTCIPEVIFPQQYKSEIFVMQLLVWIIDIQRRSCYNGYSPRKSWTRLIAFHVVLILLGKVWIQ